MKVYNAEPLGYSEAAISLIEKKGYGYIKGSWNEIDQNKQFPDVSVLIVRLSRKVDMAALSKFPALKFLVSATTGLDHIDIPALERAGVQLISLREHKSFLESIPSTAEHTWTLLLSILRNVVIANESVRNGVWDRDLFRGYQLKGKTLGIIGYGRIGKKVAAYARAFDMKVQYYDPFVESSEDEKVPELEVLMRNADILSYHIHLTETNVNVLDERTIHFVKPGAFVINTSRGGIWDENTVANALYDKKISGVAVDVLATELVNIKASPLWIAQQDGLNVIITPHIGGATWDAMWTCEEFVSQLIPANK